VEEEPQCVRIHERHTGPRLFADAGAAACGGEVGRVRADALCDRELELNQALPQRQRRAAACGLLGIAFPDADEWLVGHRALERAIERRCLEAALRVLDEFGFFVRRCAVTGPQARHRRGLPRRPVGRDHLTNIGRYSNRPLRTFS